MSDQEINLLWLVSCCVKLDLDDAECNTDDILVLLMSVITVCTSCSNVDFSGRGVDLTHVCAEIVSREECFLEFIWVLSNSLNNFTEKNAVKIQREICTV